MLKTINPIYFALGAGFFGGIVWDLIKATTGFWIDRNKTKLSDKKEIAQDLLQQMAVGELSNYMKDIPNPDHMYYLLEQVKSYDNKLGKKLNDYLKVWEMAQVPSFEIAFAKTYREKALALYQEVKLALQKWR